MLVILGLSKARRISTARYARAFFSNYPTQAELKARYPKQPEAQKNWACSSSSSCTFSQLSRAYFSQFGHNTRKDKTKKCGERLSRDLNPGLLDEKREYFPKAILNFTGKMLVAKAQPWKSMIVSVGENHQQCPSPHFRAGTGLGPSP